ncbi:Senescence regulator [Heracleum sosnowskyi]|uniref:Senescence regulator n=1 Tax=Heracleum sosnowskyi TaxID=360622 RepID=A0AAD8H749_9APIA|nr:Senescence regulator [Heracleum sosnowskyi]
MEGKYSLYNPGNSGWSSTRNEELEENDVWGVVGESKYMSSRAGKSKDFSTYNAPHGLPTAAKMIPRTHGSAHHEPVAQIRPQSAPQNIPDWSKIYGKKVSNKSSNKSLWLDQDENDGDNDYDEFRRQKWESDEDDGDENIIPPHEWIAKKLARNQISSFSVCEGAGRTLKGRDLKRVRNAILSNTGFLE